MQKLFRTVLNFLNFRKFTNSTLIGFIVSKLIEFVFTKLKNKN